MPQQNAKRRTKQASPKAFKIIVEKHQDGYVAYPLGVKGVVVGEGDTYEEAMVDVKSAIRSHIETFGETVLMVESPVLEAFVAAMEVKLLRMLHGMGIHFTAIGPQIMHHGLRQPCYCHVPTMLAVLKDEQPDYWKVITDGGVLAPEQKQSAA